MLIIDDLKFDDNDLIPVVVQDFYTNEVLTVAYMNRESIGVSLSEKRACFWSRSRQELWRKGETSGNVQHLVSLKSDCDRDALVMQVIKDGPACHTGKESCFFELLYQDEAHTQFNVQWLYDLIADRKTNPQEGSYTSYLFDKGLEKILKKIGEESTEVVIGAMKQDDREIVYEIADLCYHVLVLMVERGITVEQIEAELACRHVVDHKVKQETLK